MNRLEAAARVIRQDGLVVYPTDTIYGLGADAFSDEAIQKVFDAKKRPFSQPISVAVTDIEMVFGIAYVDETALAFIERFLPGPVTVVIPARNSVPESLTGGMGMVGIRIPNHPVALELIGLVDAPITATSANIHGARDPVTPDECHVPHDILLDAGRLPGTPSTVVDLASRKIIRRGAMEAEVAAFLREREEE
ncbi:MAG: L-threonylcarbamoyladenylate synthase [Methanolinea sp.]|jgi:L-threonylcarbamoyladenylate synthase|nr:L-threonylcarbamoyladenylate synthase [Methanolinea sp.]